MSSNRLDRRSRELRKEIIRTVEWGGRGHVTPALSLVEILRVLYDDVLRFDPTRPADPDRDRFVLSKGHGCIAQYVLLAEKGFFPRDELRRFCKFDGILGGHPETKVPGIEFSTGSLGHGLPVGVGIALAAKLDRRSYRTFVLVGDGECNEGSIWEAAMYAAKHRLSHLTVLVDYNKMTTWGATREVLDLEPFAAKWASFGFAVEEIDGHDVPALKARLASVPFAPDRPGVLICHTVKGRGIDFLEGNAAWHHKTSISPDDLARLYASLEGDA